MDINTAVLDLVVLHGSGIAVQTLVTGARKQPLSMTDDMLLRALQTFAEPRFFRITTAKCAVNFLNFLVRNWTCTLGLAGLTLAELGTARRRWTDCWTSVSLHARSAMRREMKYALQF